MITKLPVNPKVYNMVGAAKKIGVSYHTLYRMVKGGKIKAINIAHSGQKPIYAILTDEIETYLTSRKNLLQSSTSRGEGFDK